MTDITKFFPLLSNEFPKISQNLLKDFLELSKKSSKSSDECMLKFVNCFFKECYQNNDFKEKIDNKIKDLQNKLEIFKTTTKFNNLIKKFHEIFPQNYQKNSINNYFFNLIRCLEINVEFNKLNNENIKVNFVEPKEFTLETKDNIKKLFTEIKNESILYFRTPISQTF